MSIRRCALTRIPRAFGRRQDGRHTGHIPVRHAASGRHRTILRVRWSGRFERGAFALATIVDVARRAGVSVSTVSHVMNKTRNVNPDTAKAVRAAIEALSYTPSSIARSLVRSSTNTVGIAISTSSNPYFMDIICAIEQACSALGQMVFLADTKDNPDTELEVVRALHNQRVDGIVLAPSASPDRTIAYLRKNAIPCVLVDRLVSDDFDQVGIRNQDAMQTLVEHLIRVGHRKIGLIAGQPDFTTTLERIEGYRTALSKAGIAPHPDYIHPGNATVEAAAQAVKTLLALPDRPTAIATGNNLATIGAMRALRSVGLSAPEDIAIAGFDDFEWAECFEPRLTVIAQPCDQIGLQAAELLAHRIKDPDGKRTSIRLPSRLMVRRSCGSKI